MIAEQNADPSDVGRRFDRSSGLLCHVTSLATPFGVGDLGPSSIRFIDFLADAGQSLWQMLPLCPPARNNSPYSCYSALAGNAIMISPDALVSVGLLTTEDLSGCIIDCTGDPSTANQVDFDLVIANKSKLLQVAFGNFCDHASDQLKSEFQSFQTNAASWLHDFARYEALMQRFDEIDWSFWPTPIATRQPEALDEVDREFAEAIDFSKFVQFIFDLQWSSMHQYATDRGVRLCGDMPIFVAHESSDVWANQELFCLDHVGRPAMVAGVPPDYFSKTGQLWGNPQYEWDKLEETGFQWWVQRFARSFDQFDLLRVDHFRAFEAYWAIPSKAKTAVSGTWVTGPGEKPFRAAEAQLGPMPIIAEDLGMITEEVYALRDSLGYPGMRVMQFGYDNPDDDFHRPSSFPTHSVAYTGTHDNDTVMGWYHDRCKNPVSKELIGTAIDGDDDIHMQLIGVVLKSDADTAIVPIQDLLGLGNQAKMNTPGEAKGNWAWCLRPDQLTSQHAKQLRSITESTGRLR